MMTLEQNLLSDMITIYDRAKKECNYNATRFLQSISNNDPVQAAKKLILNETSGFGKLWEFGRLDLSLEALIITNKYKSLFMSEEIEVCKDRLKSAGYMF